MELLKLIIKKRENWFYFGFFLLITFLTYFNSITGDFIWDDKTYILQNSLLYEKSALFKIWLTHQNHDFWPVSYSLYFLELNLFKLNPIGYHLVNLLIHSLNCFLLFKLLPKLKVPYSFFISLIFCVHPMNVESVAWIFQAKTLLSFTFVLISTHYYVEAVFSKKWSYSLCLFFFLIANLTKTSILTWSLVLVLCDYYLQNYTITKESIKRLIPFICLSIVFGLISLNWYNDSLPISDSETIVGEGLFGRFAGAGQILSFYFLKGLVPLKLCFSYFRWDFNSDQILGWLSTIFFGLITISFFFFKSIRMKNLRLIYFYILLTLLPVLGFFDIYYMRYSRVADHYNYISLVGIITLEIVVLSVVFKPKALTQLLSFIVFVFFLLSFSRTNSFMSEKSIWEDTLLNNPSSWLAYNKLGAFYQSQGQYELANYNYKKELTIKETPHAHYNLGAILETEGKLDESLDEYKKASVLNPYSGKIENKIGTVLGKMGNIEEAIPHLEKAVTLPDGDIAAYTLSLYFKSKGDIKSAFHYINLLCERYPNNDDFLKIKMSLLGNKD